MFKPKCIGIIIDIGSKKLAKNGKTYLFHVKNALNSVLSKLEDDDLTYVYSPEGELEMNSTVAEAVGAIENYVSQKFDIHTAIQECLVLIGQYEHADKYIFIITDHYNGKSNKIIEISLKLCEKYDSKVSAFGIKNNELGKIKDLDFKELDDPVSLDNLLKSKLWQES